MTGERVHRRGLGKPLSNGIDGKTDDLLGSLGTSCPQMR